MLGLITPRGKRHFLLNARLPRIDWKHPLTSGLIACFLPTQSGVIDLVGPAILMLGSNGKITTTSEGACYDTTAASSVGASIASVPSYLTITSGGISVFWRGVSNAFPSASNEAPLIVWKTSSTLASYGIQYDGINHLSAQLGTTGGVHIAGIGTTGIGSKAMVDYGMSGTFNGTVFGFANGIQTGSASTGAAGATYGGPVLFCGFNTSGTPSWKGNLGLIYRRALSAQEMFELHSDPYGFLIYPEDELRSVFAGLIGGITVTVDSMVGWESSLSYQRDTTAPFESLASVLRDTPAPYEFAASLTRDTSVPLESFATVRRDASVPIEAFATVLTDNDAPLESLLTARQDAPVTNEITAKVRQDASVPSESGVNVTFDERVSVEITRGFTDDNLAPIEWLGTAEISVTADGHVPLEWLAAKNIDGAVGLEASAKVQVDNQLSLEFLTTLSAQAAAPLSAVSSVISNAAAPMEFSGTVRSDSGSPIEFSTSIELDSKVSDESTVTVRIDGDVPSEWQAAINLSPGGFAPIEWQLRRVNDSAVPVEFGGVRLTLDATRRFTILTPHWAYAATLPPDFYTAMAPLQQRYTALIPGNNMPALRDLPSVDAVVQTQTVAIDFGIFLPPGVTLTGTPTVTLTTTSGEDPSPSSRLKGSPVVGTVPTIQGGSGITNTAILQQVGDVVGGVRYLIVGYCNRSDGDIASGYTHFNGNTPN